MKVEKCKFFLLKYENMKKLVRFIMTSRLLNQLELHTNILIREINYKIGKSFKYQVTARMILINYFI